MVAGSAQVGLLAVPAESPFRTLVAGLAYAFILPAVALLHARNAPHRASGTVLASLTGLGVASIGIAASRDPSLRPAELILLGLWWWTLGKMSWETGTLPGRFGLVTAAAGAAALLLAVGLSSGAAPLAGDVARLALGAWLVVLALLLLRD